ncbi:MAG: hypothetical protein ORN98_07480 [Alphaproteobacteria bacterium]|nr:hypothetical protein [Alphaproteobacteria bacterium]
MSNNKRPSSIPDYIRDSPSAARQRDYLFPPTDSQNREFSGLARARDRAARAEIAANRQSGGDSSDAHPHYPAGSEGGVGGQFMPKNGGTSESSRNVRNKNPINIGSSNVEWDDMSPEQSDKDFVTFKSDEAGMNAAAQQVLSYQLNHQQNTLRGMAHRQSPPPTQIDSRTKGNTPDEYAQFLTEKVNEKMGLNITPDTPLFGPGSSNPDSNAVSPEMAFNIIRAMVIKEGGKENLTKYYPDSMIKNAVERAYNKATTKYASKPKGRSFRPAQ